MPLLSFDRHGSGPTLVWLHGFTQTRASAHRYRSILAGTNEVLTLDLPGHGTSSELHYSLDETADWLAAALPSTPVALGGYSYGARVALHVALRHPRRIAKLVVLGASRGIEDAAQRLARRTSDEALAQHIIEVGTKVFLDEWLAQPLFAALLPDERERASRSSDEKGLASSLLLSGTGTQAWLGERLHSITVPTLALAGARDTKFTIEANAIGRGVLRGTVQLISDAGHAAHLEQPARTAELVSAFLSS